MCEREFILIGVSHTDERNTKQILERVDESLGDVYHERSEDGSFLNWLYWAAINPAKALVIFSSHLSAAEFSSECERAASELAQRAGLDGYQKAGMLYSRRFKSTPLSEVIVEWLPIFTLIWAVSRFGPSLSLEIILLVVSLSALILFIGNYNEQREFPRRDDAISSNILENTPANPGKEEIVIVGEDHVSGIGGRLQARGHRVEAVWLNTLLRYSE